MKNTSTHPVKQVVRIFSISLFALTAASCATSESEKEFESQQGFKRDAYFGTQQNRDYIPQEVKDVAQ